MSIIICENHEPPLVFDVRASMSRDPWDDQCPECGRDDGLYHEISDLPLEDYARKQGARIWNPKMAKSGTGGS